MIISKSNEGLIPVTLPSCGLWLDASDLSTVTQSGGAVSAWIDKSGRGINATQGTALNQPLSGTRSFNGLNVLDFDGTNTFLSIASPYPSLVSGSTTVFAVAQYDSGTGMILGSSSTNRIYLGPISGTVNAMSLGATPITLISSVLLTDPAIRVLTYNGVTDAASYSVNNQTAATGTVTFSGGINSNAIGARDSVSPTNRMNGWIGEIIIYRSVLTAQQITTITQYLSNKWGIAIS